jgi:hypothetical protein
MFQHLVKEALGGSLVPAARDQDIEYVAVLIDRSPEIVALAADRDEQLVHMPDVTQALLSPSQGVGVCWSKLPAPGSNGLVRHRDTTLGEKVLGIANAEGEPMVQPNGMADDFGWKAVASIQ